MIRPEKQQRNDADKDKVSRRQFSPTVRGRANSEIRFLTTKGQGDFRVDFFLMIRGWVRGQDELV